jgi:hypothetical protein
LDSTDTYNGFPLSSENHNEINNELTTADPTTNKTEQGQIDDFIKEKQSELNDFVYSSNTPMQEYMKGLKDNNKIADYQRFKALNVNSSSDKIYYKVVQSRQEDSIDKMVTFNNYKNIRNNNFSDNLYPEDTSGNELHRDFNPLAQFGSDYANLLLARTDTNDGSTPPIDVIHCPFAST